MDPEYPQSFACAFCQDRYCIRTDSGRRVIFLDSPLIENLDQSIYDCPRFRAVCDFVSGRTDENPSKIDVK